jgi:hypothetical protein
LAGFLQRLDEDQSVRELLSERAELTDWKTLIEGDWYEFQWKTDQGLVPFVLREGHDRFLLLSHDQRIVTALLEGLGLAARVRRPKMLVAKFVQNSVAPVNQPNTSFSRQYRISNVFASVDGYGRSLQTVALWGDDLLGAELFLTLLKDLKPYRVTARDLRGSGDIASIGSLGEVNFYYSNSVQLRRVDTFFRHLKRGGYIRWGTTDEGQGPDDVTSGDGPLSSAS